MLKQLTNKSTTFHHLTYYCPTQSRLYKNTEKDNHYPKPLFYENKSNKTKCSIVSPKQRSRKTMDSTYYLWFM